jgi:hypothetical protein
LFKQLFVWLSAYDRGFSADFSTYLDIAVAHP